MPTIPREPSGPEPLPAQPGIPDPAAPTVPSQPGTADAGADEAVLAYAGEQLAWYARTRDRSRRKHQATELTALLTGAATVVAAGIQAPAAITASLAGAAVFIGGFRQVFHYNERYVLAAEAWSRLHLAIRRHRLVPEEARGEEARRRLLEEVEGATTAELQNWAAGQRGGGAALPPGGTPPA
ncbi:DUF4231 domain-containing protein [Streptomyces tsukubensis]|uniref:DUF4231 domain-containing protein n=1 Tax=Streptomyces tsukubensis TaxID=83656 RepID=UPI00344CF31A